MFWPGSLVSRPSVGVHRHPKFQAQAEALQSDVHRLDDALRGKEEKLSEHPDAGITSQVPGIYVERMRLPGTKQGLVRLSIFYTYDGKDVTFRFLRRAP